MDGKIIKARNDTRSLQVCKIITIIMIGPDDIVMVGIYYLPSLILAIVASVLILVGCLLAKRRQQDTGRWTARIIFLSPAPLVCWAFYVTLTFQFNSTLIMLDSESSELAENYYEHEFKQDVDTLDRAVGLAVNQRQAGNVRFYASCLVADMLSTSNDVAVSNVLRRLENASVIDTDFIGGNRLTEKFHVPGHEQAHLQPGEIIEQRLQTLRQAKQ